METNITEKDIGDTIKAMANRWDAELYALTENELETQWLFKWDSSASVEWNTYKFHDLLGLYGRQCRRWEERHNGTCCVVERVRDKYLMPKIREFLHILSNAVITDSYRQGDATQPQDEQR
jgi:hypothetical protein